MYSFCSTFSFFVVGAYSCNISWHQGHWMFPICAWIHGHFVCRPTYLGITQLVLFVPNHFCFFSRYSLKITLSLQSTIILNAGCFSCAVMFINHWACIFHMFCWINFCCHWNAEIWVYDWTGLVIVFLSASDEHESVRFCCWLCYFVFSTLRCYCTGR
jgi:hypothetical protein